MTTFVRTSRRALAWAIVVIAPVVRATDQSPARPAAGVPGADARAIKKLGTIECDMVEATPVVVRDRLYLFEYVRPDYKHKAAGETDSYFRFWDVEKKSPTPPFARGFHLGVAFVDGDTTYTYGVRKWGTPAVHVFWSEDLENWRTKVALNPPGWSIFNTSVCKAGDRYVMAIEIDKPADEAGTPFTIRFAESKNLIDWTLTPKQCVFQKDRYAACPSIRFVDGKFTMVYLEARPGPTYETWIVRSPDLVRWEASPRNPVLVHSDADRAIANPSLDAAERKRIATAKNLNNSDFDFCEFRGKTTIVYSWGNQMGVEHLALAEFDGSEADFLRGYFPK